MSKTIFVLVDACGYEAAEEYFGFLESMVDEGQATKYKVKGALPSMSRPMYETALTGVLPQVHGIVNNQIVRRSNQESIFSLCKAHGRTTGAAAYSWISELYNRAPFDHWHDRICLGTGDGLIDYGIYYWEDSYPDTHLFEDGEYIRCTYKPDFMMYHPMNIDLAGHRFGAGSAEYLNKVADTGCLISELIPLWMQDGYQIVISADHGMDEKGIHCGTTKLQRDVPLYVISSKVKKGRYTDVYISQKNIAPLLCYLLEIPYGAHMILPEEIRMV